MNTETKHCRVQTTKQCSLRWGKKARANLPRLVDGDRGLGKGLLDLDLFLGMDLDLDLNVDMIRDLSCFFRGAGDRVPLL